MFHLALFRHPSNHPTRFHGPINVLRVDLVIRWERKLVAKLSVSGLVFTRLLMRNTHFIFNDALTLFAGDEDQMDFDFLFMQRLRRSDWVCARSDWNPFFWSAIAAVLLFLRHTFFFFRPAPWSAFSPLATIARLSRAPILLPLFAIATLFDAIPHCNLVSFDPKTTVTKSKT